MTPNRCPPASAAPVFSCRSEGIQTIRFYGIPEMARAKSAAHPLYGFPILCMRYAHVSACPMCNNLQQV